MQDYPGRSVSFWLLAGQRKSIADQRKLLYTSIFESSGDLRG